jgi:hypothetical protein
VGANVGFWKSCSGCTEGEDGYVNPRDYPDHPKHPGVPQGGGCSECKGKGIVFEHFTKADAAYWAEYARTL